MAPPPPIHLDASAEAAFVAYSSSEPDALGGSLDREDGILEGAWLRSGVRWRGLRVQAEGLFASGSVAYTGRTQLGLPIESRTSLVVGDLGINALYPLGCWPVFLGVTVRSRRVNRTIEATAITQSLHEILTQIEVGPLVATDVPLPFALELAAQASAAGTLLSRLDVDFLDTYDGGRLRLPMSFGGRAAVTLSRALGPVEAAFVEVGGEVIGPASSKDAPLTRGGVPVGLYHYPGSTQSTGWLGAGIRIAL